MDAPIGHVRSSRKTCNTWADSAHRRNGSPTVRQDRQRVPAPLMPLPYVAYGETEAICLHGQARCQYAEVLIGSIFALRRFIRKRETADRLGEVCSILFLSD